MNLLQTIDIYGGGFGSRCNPENGPCGRRPKSIKTRKINADAMMKEAEELYGDASAFKLLLAREIKDAYPSKSLRGWGELSMAQRKTIATRCMAKAQDRARSTRK